MFLQGAGQPWLTPFLWHSEGKGPPLSLEKYEQKLTNPSRVMWCPEGAQIWCLPPYPLAIKKKKNSRISSPVVTGGPLGLARLCVGLS